MKIFFIASDIPYPGFSGGNVINWSIVNYLIERGHKLTLFVNPPRFGENEIEKNLEKKMINLVKSLKCDFVSIDFQKKIKKKNYFQKLISNKFEDYYKSCNVSSEIGNLIDQKVSEIQPDLMLCYGSAAMHWTKDIKIKKSGWVDLPTATYYATLLMHEGSRFSISYLKKLILYLKARSFLKKDIVIEANDVAIPFVHSGDYKKYFLESGLKKCPHIIPPYFDHIKFHDKKIEKPKRDYFKIIIPGLMSTLNKSQLFILKNYVFPYLEKNIDMKKIQFHMVGTKYEDMPKYFQNKDYVVARGFVEDFNYELQDCDLFYCMTPYRLGLRTRILDALNYGNLILTSNLDKISLPFLEDKKNCYIVEDFKSIGSSIIEIMEDANASDIKKNARKAYEEELSFKVAGKKFEDIILYEKY